MTNVSRLVIVLGFLFWTAGISTTGYSQPPLPYTHYEIVNVEVQGKLEVGEPVTIVVTIQDMSNVSSSSGTYEIYINRTPVDYDTIYLSSGDSTTVRYTHYFDAPGTYSIDIGTCSKLGGCPDDTASETISIKDSSTPPPPPPPSQAYLRFTGTLTNVSEAESDVGWWLLYTIKPDSYYGLGSGIIVRAGPVSCVRGQIDVYVDDIGSRVEVYSTTDGDVSCAPAYIRKISGPPNPPTPPGDINHPPSVTLSCYPLNLTPNDTLSCEASASDPNGDPLTYEWFLNEQKLTKISPSSNRVYWDKPQPGFYTLKVVVSDNRGGTSQSSVSFTVQETQQNRPPVIQSIEYAPSDPAAGQLVRFWASVYDENGWIVAYEWDFGSLPFQVEEQPEYAWQNPGTYRVCLTVYDNDGDSARKCRDITVQAARTLLPPQANFTFSPSSPKVGETVYFRDRSTDPDNGRITRWLWSFGNEQFSYESNPSYTYQQAGRYTVCLAVFDNDDLSDKQCIDIIVQPDDRLTKQPPAPRFTMTAPNGQTAQENQTLTLTVPRGGKVSINFSASNSYDPDGGGIRSYEWWINGTFVSQSSQFSFELGANTPRHLIQLKVTDDEGQTSEVGATVIITEQQTPSANPTLRVEGSTSSTKQQGQTFNLSGGGYSPNGSVRVFVLKDDKIIDLFQRQADRNGNISWSWPTDCNTATGTYELQAIDETTNTPSNSITEIVMSNPACVTSTVNPKLWVDNKESSERKQGDENPFVLTGSGFTPNGTIRRFVRKPDGTQTEISQITADNNGNIPSGLWKWTPQCNDPTGTYEVWAVDVRTEKRSSTVTEIVMSNPACVASTVNPKLWVDNKESSERKQGDENPFVLTGSGFTPNGTIRRFVKPPNGKEFEVLPHIRANSQGRFGEGVWDWKPGCENDTGVYEVWVVDVDRNNTPSNIVKEIVMPGGFNCPVCELDKKAIPNDNQPDDSALQCLLNQGGNIALAPGEYIIQRGLIIKNKDKTTLTSTEQSKRVRFVAHPDLANPILIIQNAKDVVISFIEFDGNRPARSKEKQLCVGYRGRASNIIVENTANFKFINNRLTQTLCGTALEIKGKNNSNFEIANNLIDNNGNNNSSQNAPEPWSDGITLHSCNDGWVHDNDIKDATDVGIVTGGGQGKCLIENNRVTNSKLRAFAGIGLGYFEPGAGNHEGSIIRGNVIIAEKPNLLGFGLSIGIHPWLEKNVHGGLVENNIVKGAIVNLQVDGISGVTIKNNRMEQPQGEPSCGGKPANYTVSTKHTSLSALQDGWIDRDYDNCIPNSSAGIGTGDVVGISPQPTTQTIEQAIASLVPNDPPDVANPDVIVGDVEMTRALGYYEKQEPVPNTGGKIIDDVTMLRLQDLWLSRRSVSSSSSLITSETSPRRKWGLLTRLLARHTVEFVALGFDVRSIRVEIFNLQGQRVFAEEAPNNRLTFRGQDSQGQRLANGVYLYVVTVRSHDGTIQRSSVRKLILQR
jgi:PKD repeat protein